MHGFTTIGVDNIKRVYFDKFENDFSFIVNGEVYPTNSFVANILSPNISNMLKGNNNISYYQIDTTYEGDFSRIIEYGEMKVVNIDKEETQYFHNIMMKLGNNEEAIRFSKELQEDISDENVIQRIQIKKDLDIDFNEEVDFISSNFHNFYKKNPKMFSKLNVDIIEKFFSSNRLRIYDEDEIFDIILQLYLESTEYSPLFSYIMFANLTTESIQKFIKFFDINNMNQSIWRAISHRLEQNLSPELKEEYNKMYWEFHLNRHSCSYQKNLIQYLNGESPPVNVNITSSSIFEKENYKVENIIEQNDQCLITKDEVDSWVQFDFKTRKFELESYTLKSESCGYLKNWILEVSDDGKNFIEIDRHEKCDLLKGGQTSTFKVSFSTPKRFVRLKQVGENWSGNNWLAINYIEFSGFPYNEK